MRIVMINSVNYGSTGNIMLGIAQAGREAGMSCYTACPDCGLMHKRQPTNQMLFGGRVVNRLHQLLGEWFGLQGLFSFFSTKQFLKKVDALQPELIHLHNLHNTYLNIPTLFRYIKKRKIGVVWTLHDCWSFTGHCPYFTIAQCDKWKNGCFGCPSYREYPQAKVDTSKVMWRWKRKWFTGIADMTIVTPSQWLADLVKESYLKEYPVKVLHNGIDLSVFRPTISDFRERHRIPSDAKLLLGVAFYWGERKGLDVFLALAERLSKEYQIVLVGTDDLVDAQLPERVISIHLTQNQKELAEIYTAADLFVNPTREEVFGLVNVEALACGTPVVTFRTGGSPEGIDETCGAVVDCDDIDALECEIIRICEQQPYTKEACIARAMKFDKAARFKDYIRLYEEMVK